MKVLMVCLGNICRSPLAEGILAQKAAQKGLDWQVDSAGTGNYHIGEKPDPRSMAVAEKYGLDISHQRCRQLKASDLDTFDLILAMDASNYNNIKRLANSEEQINKIQIIRNFVHEGQNLEVPDPYYGDSRDYEKVYHLLDEACECVIQKYE